jgi:type IV secretion system protein VirB9
MTRFLLPAACVLAFAVTPLAAKDARLASRPYNASEVVRIDGKAGVQAAIAFADEEQIENVAIGDSAKWQVTPNKRATMLFLKPLSASARTNMTVVTDKRSYYFDLVASPAAQPLYVLRFTYPEEAKKAQAAGAPVTPALTQDEALALTAPPAEAAAAKPAAPAQDPAQDPARLNFAWQGKGKRRLLPTRIYDDGNATYLSWPAGTDVPAILVQDGRGAEGAVNFAVRDDVVVIEGVPPLLVLRSGHDAALIENRGRPRKPRPAPAREAVRQKAAIAAAAPAVAVAPSAIASTQPLAMQAAAPPAAAESQPNPSPDRSDER